jgi:YVTN family beta-propeller protein
MFCSAAFGADDLCPSSIAISPDGATAYVAETGTSVLASVDLVSGKTIREIRLSVPPSGIALSAKGDVAYLTGGVDSGKALVVDLAKGEEIASIAVGHTPMAPVASPDGKTLYVCNRFNNDISVIDLAAKKEIARIAVSREPVAAAFTPDGKWLVATNLLPDGPANAYDISAKVSFIDARANKVVKDIRLPNGSSGARGVAVSPNGRFAYVTHILARYQLPTTQLERGWMNTNALSVIDVSKQSLVNTVLLDEAERGAANPWGVLCTSDGRFICVAHAGTQEISVIDAEKLHSKLDRLAAGQAVSDVARRPEDVSSDLSFLVDLRTRIPLAGNGPRSIAASGYMIVAAEYFTDSLSVADITPDAHAAARKIALGPEKGMSVTRKGEMFFNDAALCFQNWQSCASCHPDARADSLNWDLLNDGMGNPKNTKSMLHSHETPPVMSLGVRASAELAVRAGIKYIQFATRPEEDAKAIDEYLKAMKPVPSPYVGEAAKRGKAIFESAGCSQCHAGAYGTDLKAYDVGTATDEHKEYDTPALSEVWRTAPYLHDGRAVTIMDVLTTFNKDDSHGKTSDLSPDQLKDLVAYVLSF